MARRLRQSPEAKQDIKNIWHYTAAMYNADQADTYGTLIRQALRDIKQNPERPSSLPRPDLGDGIRSYHIELSKKRSGMGIKTPRHIIYYSLKYEQKVVVLRVLHDRMDPKRYLQNV